jgi:hypothetical protein
MPVDKLHVDHKYIQENAATASPEELKAMLAALDLEEAVENDEIVIRYGEEGEARFYPAGYFDNE